MLMDCKKAAKELKGTPLEDAINKLSRFDMYHLLFKPLMSSVLHTAERFSFAPEEYLQWSNYCAGGDLQTIEFLGEKGFDKETGVKFGTFDMYVQDGKIAGVSSEYAIFAVANFGDFFCFRKTSDETRDSAVYQWGTHEEDVVLVWDSFADWLSDQVNIWVNMIAENELDPIGLKMEDTHA